MKHLSRHLEGQTFWEYKYLKIPFVFNGRDWSGCDCYGLVRLIWGTELGRWLPKYQYEDNKSAQSDVNSFSGEKSVKVNAGFKKFDVVIMRSVRYGFHIGMMINDNKFIHTDEHTGVQIVNIAHPLWQNKIIEVRRLND